MEKLITDTFKVSIKSLNPEELIHIKELFNILYPQELYKMPTKMTYTTIQDSIFKKDIKTRNIIYTFLTSVLIRLKLQKYELETLRKILVEVYEDIYLGDQFIDKQSSKGLLRDPKTNDSLYILIIFMKLNQKELENEIKQSRQL